MVFFVMGFIRWVLRWFEDGVIGRYEIMDS